MEGDIARVRRPFAPSRDVAVGSEELDFGEALASGIPGLSKEFPGLLGIEGDGLWGDVGTEGRRDAVGRQLAALQDVVDEGLQVECCCQGVVNVRFRLIADVPVLTS